MNNSAKWIRKQYRTGWAFLITGGLVAIAGALLPVWISATTFNTRIVTGVGIFLIGVGLSYLIRYRAARREPLTGARMANEANDERSRMLRARAGNRAYWVSTALAYGGLMWVSFAANGSLPHLSEDALWYFLAAVVIIPFGVYAIGLTREEERE